MTQGIQVLLKFAVSLDGYINDCSDQRLILSNEEDLEQLDRVRAASDAILVGAATVRADNPKLLVRSSEQQAWRASSGRSSQPIKVTLTNSGVLKPSYSFFEEGGGRKIVFCPRRVEGELKKRLGGVGEIFALGEENIPLLSMMKELQEQGVQNLLVEGGSRTAGAFLQAELIDELEVSIAPFLVGDPAAPRFLGCCPFNYGKDNRIKLMAVQQLGDMVLLRYRLHS